MVGMETRKPQPPIHTAPHDAARVLKAGYRDRVKVLGE